MKLNLRRTLTSVSGLLILAANQAWACQQGGGSVILFPTLGGSGVEPFALNAAGQVTGFSLVTGDTTAHAFLYNGGVMTDLGTFGGDNSQGFAINASGQVAGEAETDNFETHAALYDGTTLVDLGTLGGSSSHAAAINNAGAVVGSSLNLDAANEAFVYSGGLMTGLGDLGGGSSSAIGINQNGNIIGNSHNLNDDEHAFFYSNGSMTDLGTLGGLTSTAHAVNDSDAVVGEALTVDGDTHAFLWTSGPMTDLGTLGGTFSAAYAINNAGQIIGDSFTAGDNDSHGFIYSAGVMTDLGTLGGNDSMPLAINNLGQVVGASTVTIASGNTHAFLWQSGTMVDLNTTLPPGSGWELITADLINDAGRIVGSGNYNGNFRWYIMDLGQVNNPPVANAGPDQTVQCNTQVTLNGSQSSDPDNDSLTYEWSEGNTVLGAGVMLTVSLPTGSHTITLTVTDPCGSSSSDTVVVQVSDTIPPMVTCPGAITASANSSCQAAVPNVVSQVVASDNCTGSGSLTISQNPTAGTLLGLGHYTIEVTVTDGSGNSSVCHTPFNVVDTTAPVIVSGPPLGTISADNQCQAAVPNVVPNIVATDNCTPANALSIAQAPSAGTLVGLGSHDIVVTVMDASGNHASGTLSFTVADTTAPTITSAPTNVTVSTGANCQGAVPNLLPLVSASDNCTAAGSLIKSQNPVAGTLLGTGQHTVTITVTDAASNSATANVTLTVADGGAPTIQSVTANPNVLYPPNHQLVPVTVTVVASDSCDPAPTSQIISVTADEAIDPGDINITGNLTVNLASSKNSMGTDRVYTITVRTTDASGNSSTATVTVTVKKSNGNTSTTTVTVAAKKSIGNNRRSRP